LNNLKTGSWFGFRKVEAREPLLNNRTPGKLEAPNSNLLEPHTTVKFRADDAVRTGMTLESVFKFDVLQYRCHLREKARSSTTFAPHCLNIAGQVVLLFSDRTL
jgi:environmental stress-induced protein Ves